MGWRGSALTDLSYHVAYAETPGFTAFANPFIGDDAVDDRFVGDWFGNDMEGGGGHDHIYGSLGDDTVRGGTGDDTLFGNGGRDLVIGDDGNDHVLGGAGSDTVSGSAGNDRLDGYSGNDWLRGGADDDTLIGGPGNDRLDGDSGVDIALFVRQASAAHVDLAAGTATGGGGTDTLIDIENVFGSAWNDTIHGDDAPNRLNGSGGDDSILGGGGPDTLLGSDGDDRLYGEAGGNDILVGGVGDDFLAGGPGHDRMIGGPGADQFVFLGNEDLVAGAHNVDKIADFNVAEGDLINLFFVDGNVHVGGNQSLRFTGETFGGANGDVRVTEEIERSGAALTRVSIDYNGDKISDADILLVAPSGVIDADAFVF
nr:calcium-binding protein [Cognatishimia sp. F0-27]